MLSVILLAVGVLLEAIAQILNFGSLLPAVVSYLGFFVIFMSILVMLVTIIAIMLPKVRKQLETCQH